MAIDEKLAARVQAALSGEQGITDKKMFGGLCYLHNGNMVCGLDKNGYLMLRVGPELYGDVLAMKHAREMDFTGRPLKGFIYIEPEGFATDDELKKWLAIALEFTATLPAKKK